MAKVIVGLSGGVDSSVAALLLKRQGHEVVGLDAAARTEEPHPLPEVWVVELSSFQLDGIEGFDPSAATVLNLSQDHLDWHGSMDAYAAAKARVFGAQGLMVLNRDDALVMAMLPAPVKVKGGKPGDKVKLQVLRGDKASTVELTYGERPAPKGGGGGFGGPGGATVTRPFGANYGGQAANVQEQQGPDGFQYGGVYKSTDGGASWKRINSINPRPMYFSQVRVDPSDSDHVVVLGVSLAVSRDGGKSFQTGGRGVHADHHALWIDPRDGRHQIIGTESSHGLWGQMQKMGDPDGIAAMRAWLDLCKPVDLPTYMGALTEREARGLLGQCEELERHLQGVRRALPKAHIPGSENGPGAWPAPRPRPRG